MRHLWKPNQPQFLIVLGEFNMLNYLIQEHIGLNYQQRSCLHQKIDGLSICTVARRRKMFCYIVESAGQTGSVNAWAMSSGFFVMVH